MCSDHLRCPDPLILRILRLLQVTCVYLFHELPAESRRKAAAEMARVLKPGGILVLTDSVQYGDRPVWDKMLGMFSKFNEPYYMSYISEDLGAVPDKVSSNWCCAAFLEAKPSKGSQISKQMHVPAPHCIPPGSARLLQITHGLLHGLQGHCLRRLAWFLTTSWCPRPRRPCRSASSELASQTAAAPQ